MESRPWLRLVGSRVHSLAVAALRILFFSKLVLDTDVSIPLVNRHQKIQSMLSSSNSSITYPSNVPHLLTASSNHGQRYATRQRLERRIYGPQQKREGVQVRVGACRQLYFAGQRQRPTCAQRGKLVRAHRLCLLDQEEVGHPYRRGLVPDEYEYACLDVQDFR